MKQKVHWAQPGEVEFKAGFDPHVDGTTARFIMKPDDQGDHVAIPRKTADGTIRVTFKKLGQKEMAELDKQQE